MKTGVLSMLVAVCAGSACGMPARAPAALGRFMPDVCDETKALARISGHMSVEVLHEDGSPAAGADVIAVLLPERGEDDPLAEPFQKDVLLQNGTVVDRDVADAHGATSLKLLLGWRERGYAYVGEYAGFGAPAEASLITRTENLFGYEIHLVPAIPVSGNVVGADGRPAPGVRVRAAFRSRHDGEIVVLRTSCTEAGAFALPPVPLGWREPLSVRADAEDGRSVRGKFSAAELRAGPARLVLSR